MCESMNAFSMAVCLHVLRVLSDDIHMCALCFCCCAVARRQLWREAVMQVAVGRSVGRSVDGERAKELLLMFLLLLRRLAGQLVN